MKTQPRAFLAHVTAIEEVMALEGVGLDHVVEAVRVTCRGELGSEVAWVQPLETCPEVGEGVRVTVEGLE